MVWECAGRQVQKSSGVEIEGTVGISAEDSQTLKKIISNTVKAVPASGLQVLPMATDLARNLVKGSGFGSCLLFLVCHYTAFLFSTRAMTTLE